MVSDMNAEQEEFYPLSDGYACEWNSSPLLCFADRSLNSERRVQIIYTNMNDSAT